MGNAVFRTPGTSGINNFSLGDFQLEFDPRFKPREQTPCLRGPMGSESLQLGVPRLSLGDVKLQLDGVLHSSRRDFLWQALNKLPVTVPPPALAKLLGRSGALDLSFLFGPLPGEEVLLFFLAEKLDSLATEMNKILLLDQLNTEQMTFWLAYVNDGGPPFNPGSGSDQGPTARLSLFVTFDKMRTGLTKLGVTVIDMHTPRGYLDGQAFDSSSTYHSDKGSYSGIASLDFEVTVQKTGLVNVKILSSVGVDSSEWGRFVQDFIHKKISGSPLFPWPRDVTKPFAEVGAAALVTPQWVLTQDTVLGFKYHGKIEFDAKAVAGTHRTEATVGARVVLRTATIDTPLGNLNLEFTTGAFGRGFMRYNNGSEGVRFGIEVGGSSSFMLKVGSLGIGVEGQITASTDPALQTNNPAGSAPLLNPLSSLAGEPTGGPKGHHGLGRVIMSWTF